MSEHRPPEEVIRHYRDEIDHPDELEEELGASGLRVREVAGVEGLAGWLGHLAGRWHDPAAREAILRSARAVEAEACLRGLSAHLLAVAVRPAPEMAPERR